MLVAISTSVQADPSRDRPRFVGPAAIFPLALEVARHSAEQLGGHSAIGEMIGSTPGFALFCGGMGTAYPDIAFSSRAMNDGERANCDSHGVVGVARAEMGHGGLVLVTRSGVAGLDKLTAHQLWRALAAVVPHEDAFRPNTYQRWSEIDASLPDLPIEVVVPSSNSGWFNLFVDLIVTRGCLQDPMVREIRDPVLRQRFCTRLRGDHILSHTRSDITRTEAMLEGPAGRVAVADLLDFQRHRDEVRTVAIDGVQPMLANFSDGTYPLVHPIYAYVKMPQMESIRGLDLYLQALLDEAAIGDTGYLVPLGLAVLPAERRAAQRRLLFGS